MYFPPKKVKTLRVSLPDGTAAGTQVVEVETFANYGKVTGFYIPAADSFDPPVRVGVTNGASATLHELTSLRHFAASLSLGHDERFFPMEIGAQGNEISFTIEVTDAIVGDQSFDLVIMHEEPSKK